MPPTTRGEMPTPPPPLDGELHFDEVTRNGRADDFGHIVHNDNLDDAADQLEGIVRAANA